MKIECPKYTIFELDKLYINGVEFDISEYKMDFRYTTNCFDNTDVIRTVIVNEYGFAIPYVVDLGTYYGILVPSMYDGIAEYISECENCNGITFIDLSINSYDQKYLRYKLCVSPSNKFIVNTSRYYGEDGFSFSKRLYYIKDNSISELNIFEFELYAGYDEDDDYGMYVNIYIRYDTKLVQKYIKNGKLVINNDKYYMEVEFDENFNVKRVYCPLLDKYCMPCLTKMIIEKDEDVINSEIEYRNNYIILLN